jgi:hypothetical protein
VQVGDCEARQGHIGVTGQLAREPFNVDDDAGGKSGLCARLEVLPPGRVFGRRKTGGAICSRSAVAYRVAWR